LGFLLNNFFPLGEGSLVQVKGSSKFFCRVCIPPSDSGADDFMVLEINPLLTAFIGFPHFLD